MLALYLSVLDDRNFEEDFTEVYNTYKRLVYHTAYKIMDDSSKILKLLILGMLALLLSGIGGILGDIPLGHNGFSFLVLHFL